MQFILALMAYASKRDIDPSRVCHQAGLNFETLQRTNSLSHHQVESLWKNLVTVGRDPLFGLHFGESMQLAALGVVGQMIQTSRNVGEALTTAGTLVPLVSDMFSMQINHSGKVISIHLSADEAKKNAFPVTYKQMADYLMVFIVHELDGLLLRKVNPLGAHFPYDISSQSEYTRVMRCNVYRDDKLLIELDKAYLDEVIISANYEIQNYLMPTIRKLLDNHRQESQLRSSIYNHLLTNSYLFENSLESTAANFNMSVRTLQRKLQEEGVTFQEIADDVRKNLATSYLASGNFQVKDVAYLLGYKEQSALVRAFKRWTGTTPGNYIQTFRKS